MAYHRRLLAWVRAKRQAWNDAYDRFLWAEGYWLYEAFLTSVKRLHEVTDCTKCMFPDISMTPVVPARTPKWRSGSRNSPR